MQSERHTAYLGLGSNLGDRAAYLLRALMQLQRHGIKLKALSSLYQTAPVDNLAQPDFLNLVVAVEPRSDDPFALLRLCWKLEAALGRVRITPKGARTVDLDLLLFDDLLIDDVRAGVSLTLPHPRLHLRRFVLAPRAEIAPELQHPARGATMRQLLAALTDDAAVQIYQE